MRYNIELIYLYVVLSCGLVMNKDEIQHNEECIRTPYCCGLVMNKDEIQLFNAANEKVLCCGLVMNKDEIQQ